jgi:DNA-binding MltR family transcriptional regulator
MSKVLKKLSACHGGQPEEIAKFFEEMKSDSARGAVAAISALVEEELGIAIKSKMVSLSKDEGEALFEYSGPLATLSARINIGYALGLYGKKAKKDLNLVREIRNAFVHAKRHIDFDAPEVVQLCRQFYSVACHKDLQLMSARDQF